MASLEHIRHSLAHLLATAVLEHDPHAKLAIGPVIDTGFYYDIQFSSGFSDEHLPALEARMRELVGSALPFERIDATPAQAREQFSRQPFKLELIDELEKSGDAISLYQTGSFIDLCRGGHVDNTQEIPGDAFKLERVAGAYWRGDSNREMLTRIYGLAFASKEELDAYLARREEALKRDHRKLGKELDLFTFSDLVGSGLPLFTPRGTVLREEINKLSQELRERRGYQKVWIPHITKKNLYETSGHWDKFGDELFLVKSQETSDELVMKPMNCPHHQQIYASQKRSYRDLPIKYLETTTIYRDEKAGELLGLSRVRSITQDDSHVFCTPEQLDLMYTEVLDVVKEFYAAVNMPLKIRLSFRNRETPEEYLGEESLWSQAEDILRKTATRAGLEFYEAPGEAAFYGPKIDFMATDSIGRQWQVATGQLDFVQPKRFGITYTDRDGTEKTPIMIHFAVAGSLERFLSVYIEHTAGNFPLWLAPLQAAILPVGESHHAYAQEVAAALKEAGMRVEVSLDDSLGKRIRAAKMLKVPYTLVLGDKELEAHTVTLESRDKGNLGAIALTDALAQLSKEAATRA